jgi:hypothetical protein
LIKKYALFSRKKMLYKSLPENLHAHADTIADYLREDRGVTHFKAEEPIESDLQYRPTIQGVGPDKYIVAVEVQDKPDTGVLDSVVLDCVSRAIPVKLFLAFPEPVAAMPHQVVENIHKKGMGLIEMRATGPVVLAEALPLSLFGYRLDRLRFPAKLRGTLLEADNTFRSGSPPKACSLIYEEIEGLSRELVKKTKKKKMWRKLRTGEKPSKLDLDNGPWEKVLDYFEDFYLVNKKKVPNLTSNLIHRIAATTTPRNQAAHKPRTLKERVQRDQELRTRFESAVDLLFDLVKVLSEVK